MGKQKHPMSDYDKAIEEFHSLNDQQLADQLAKLSAGLISRGLITQRAMGLLHYAQVRLRIHHKRSTRHSTPSTRTGCAQ